MKIYLDPRVKKFILSLEKQTIAKVAQTIDLLEKFGNRLTSPHSKKVHKKIFELRIRGKQEIRILYTFHEETAYLLHGFTKQKQKISKKEIKTALKRLEDLTLI